MAHHHRVSGEGGPEPRRGAELNAVRHTAFEDAQGLVFGATMVALGLTLLQHMGLVTGQTAGMALLISRWTGLEFGPVFFAVNLPFYWLAWSRLGRAFTIKTFIGVALVSAMSAGMPHVLTFAAAEPLAGAAIAGMACGSGVLALFRHRASLGGIGVLAIYLQERFSVRAGWTQMGVDAVVFSLAFLVLDPLSVIYSMIGAGVLNAFIAINHRRDWYIAI